MNRLVIFYMAPVKSILALYMGIVTVTRKMCTAQETCVYYKEHVGSTWKFLHDFHVTGTSTLS